MDKSTLRTLIQECISETTNEAAIDSSNPLIIQYFKRKTGERMFKVRGQRFIKCWGKYPNGRHDIAVLSVDNKICYSFDAFNDYLISIGTQPLKDAVDPTLQTNEVDVKPKKPKIYDCWIPTYAIPYLANRKELDVTGFEVEDLRRIDKWYNAFKRNYNRNNALQFEFTGEIEFKPYPEFGLAADCELTKVICSTPPTRGTYANPPKSRANENEQVADGNTKEPTIYDCWIPEDAISYLAYADRTALDNARVRLIDKWYNSFRRKYNRNNALTFDFTGVREFKPYPEFGLAADCELTKVACFTPPVRGQYVDIPKFRANENEQETEDQNLYPLSWKQSDLTNKYLADAQSIAKDVWGDNVVNVTHYVTPSDNAADFYRVILQRGEKVMLARDKTGEWKHTNPVGADVRWTTVPDLNKPMTEATHNDYLAVAKKVANSVWENMVNIIVPSTLIVPVETDIIAFDVTLRNGEQFILARNDSVGWAYSLRNPDADWTRVDVAPPTNEAVGEPEPQNSTGGLNKLGMKHLSIAKQLADRLWVDVTDVSFTDVIDKTLIYSVTIGNRTTPISLAKSNKGEWKYAYNVTGEDDFRDLTSHKWEPVNQFTLGNVGLEENEPVTEMTSTGAVGAIQTPNWVDPDKSRKRIKNIAKKSMVGGKLV